ncbi:hypothetical protein H5P36_20940 [Bacillus sp. APMAM]|nr:hypothetical protein [Bacillus sp. APMAM]RTZ53941.1 hypothetical protein EKO25_20550 [Bacillus sp. SAJ1]
MKLTLKHGFIVLLTFLVIFTSIPISGLAETMNPKTQSSSTQVTDSSNSIVTDPEGEVISKRTENTRVLMLD